MDNCLHCAHWRITKKVKGKTVLLEMAAYRYGQCAKGNSWEYLGQSYSCKKFEQAVAVVVDRRKKELGQ